MLWIILIVVCFITFCATPLGQVLLQKLNDYTYKKEMERIEKDWRADVKKIDEAGGTDFLGYLDRKEAEKQDARAAQIENLKQSPEVLFAYSEYLEKIQTKRRVKKVLTLEEFIERNFL